MSGTPEKTEAVAATAGSRPYPMRVLRAGRRMGWGILDQAFSSFTNFLLGVFVAHAVGVRGFGIFGLIFVTYSMTMGSARAITGSPLGIRFSDTNPERLRAGIREATGAAFGLGAIVGVLTIIVSAIFFSGSLRDTLFVFGATMPLLILQDEWRYAFFASGRGDKALVNDVLWALVMVPGLGLMLLLGFDSMTSIVAVWSGSACVAGLYGARQARVMPDPLALKRWIVGNKDLVKGLLGDWSILAGSTRASTFLVAAVAGVTATASIRGADILLGPFTVILMGVTPLAVPEAVRIINRRRHRLQEAMIILSAGLATASILVGLAMYELPDSIGRLLLHDTWKPARSVVFVLALALAVSAANTGAQVGMRSLGATRNLVQARMIAAPIIAVGIVIGAVLGGAVGAAGGNAVATAIVNIEWWRRFRMSNAAYTRPAPVDPVEEEISELE